MKKVQELTIGNESILNEVNLREAKASEFVEMIKDTNVEEWDLDLIWRVHDLMRDSCSVRFSLAGVYQMGYICGIRAERKRRETGEA
ncbi:hypothetical protein [Desulfosporosinus sp.]|uniref:hypothetical protein n=1 Tax=Desulfosporosinus sp. TaxID=157907 RepID=UPI002630DE40|nr:hypothetical protein [Desulfosporosinus sp.]